MGVREQALAAGKAGPRGTWPMCARAVTSRGGSSRPSGDSDRTSSAELGARVRSSFPWSKAAMVCSCEGRRGRSAIYVLLPISLHEK